MKRSRGGAGVLVAAAVIGCATSRAPTKAESIARGPSPLGFIEDDYPRARATAIERKIPIFIDVWAPW